MENILFVSLGCDKNTVDSEKMIGLLAMAGYQVTDNEKDADIAIVNTCCFIGDAKQESIDTLIELGNLKKQGRLKYLIACGCLAQRYADEIQTELKEVDAVIGTASYDKIVEAIDELRLKEACGEIKRPDGESVNESRDDRSPVKILDDINRLPEKNTLRIMTTPGHYEYLKIAEGCNKNCSYCIIPKVRGSYRSIPMEELIEEARKLVDKGVKELILVAQETTLYGVDLYGYKALGKLLERLSEIEKLCWIRIMYSYPEEITDEMIDIIASNEKICHYIDMPIQHCSDRILKLMGRRTNRAELTQRIASIRNKIPDVILRTSLITGFPGETQKEHEEMLDFIKEIKFDRLGCFTYSPEEGTVAALMEGQIDEELKQKWRDDIMMLQADIAFEKADLMIGREMKAIIEGRLIGEDVYVARTGGDAPDVDGYAFVDCEDELETGDMVDIRIVSSSGYDLIGEVI